MPWLGETGPLLAVSSIDTQSAAALLSFPWVIDGITPIEASAITGVRNIMYDDIELARTVLNLWWMQDPVSEVERYALRDIAQMARHNNPLAWQVLREPFMEPPFRQRDEYALKILADLSFDSPGSTTGADLLEQLSAQPWFSDGLDDQDTALLYGIAASKREFREALFRSHHVEIRSITLPLAGDVDLVMISHLPVPNSEDSFAAMEDSLLAIEDFMDVPFPVTDVIVIVAHPDLWRISSGAQRVAAISGGTFAAYTDAHIRLNPSQSGLPKDALYHELGHYYDLRGHRWLYEGAAQFLEAYTRERVGTETLEQRSANLVSAGGCGRTNIQQQLDDPAGRYCDYYLGERFMLAMYEALGRDVVSAALRDMYMQSLFFVDLNEDIIYQAFLSNVPEGTEDEFKAVYRTHHGGPVVDAAAENNPGWHPLTALYFATDGENWANNQNWTSDTPIGTWYGVDTEAQGRVQRLELEENQLRGTIPEELGDLSSLQRLYLAANSLEGEIPSTLGNLSNLKSLRLGRNRLTGAIPPQLGNLTNLRSLGLWENQLGEAIPPELAGMTSIQSLDLGVNQLTGPIPSQLANLPNLQYLTLSRNQLTGEIPAALGNLTSLVWLDLGKNQLTGKLPPELGNLSGMETLRLWENNLTGSIPSELGDLPNLSSLELSHNQLTGEIPAALSRAMKLRVLRLNANQLSGEIPPELGRLGELWSLNLGNNQLTGGIPAVLASLSNLEELYLSGNRFTGCIPDGLRDIPQNDLAQLGLPFCSASS